MYQGLRCYLTTFVIDKTKKKRLDFVFMLSQSTEVKNQR